MRPTAPLNWHIYPRALFLADFSAPLSLPIAAAHASFRKRLAYPTRPSWYWSDARANDCIGVYGGSSGSPVFAKDGKRVIGILSTATDSCLNGCGFARPCELAPAGTVSRPEAVYTHSVDHILAAFRPDNTLDLSNLDPGTGIAIERVGSWSTCSAAPNEHGQLQPASWGLKISKGFEWIRYKSGSASSIQCALPKGYGAPVRAVDQPLLKLPVDQREGFRRYASLANALDRRPGNP